MSEGIDDFLVGGNHPFTHLAAQLALQFGIVHHSSHKVHHPGGPPLLLGEVVLAMALEELVVGAHQTPHHVDKVPEDFHSADTEEVLGRGVLSFHGIGYRCSKRVNVLVHVAFVRCDKGKYAA